VKEVLFDDQPTDLKCVLPFLIRRQWKQPEGIKKTFLSGWTTAINQSRGGGGNYGYSKVKIAKSTGSMDCFATGSVFLRSI
jgi:hypothetical protein